MNITIEVHSTDCTSFTWTDRKNAQRTGYKQAAYARLPDAPYPKEIKLRVDEPSKAYAKGVYLLDAKSFWIDRYGSLQVNPVLTLAPASQSKSAAA
ncbi:MAG: single-stranded DNA-binding protein [Pseudomonadota bacterium]